jgi:hypothetical protein
MRFVLTMIGDDTAIAALPADEAEAFGANIEAFNKALQDSGAWVDAVGIGPKSEAKTLTFDSGSASVASGPYADTPDQALGYWIIEAADIDEAVDLGSKLRLASGSIDIRPAV